MSKCLESGSMVLWGRKQKLKATVVRNEPEKWVPTQSVKVGSHRKKGRQGREGARGGKNTWAGGMPRRGQVCLLLGQGRCKDIHQPPTLASLGVISILLAPMWVSIQPRPCSTPWPSDSTGQLDCGSLGGRVLFYFVLVFPEPGAQMEPNLDLLSK